MSFESISGYFGKKEAWCGLGAVAIWFLLTLVVGFSGGLFKPLLPIEILQDHMVSMRTFDVRTKYKSTQEVVWAFLWVTWPLFSIFFTRSCGCDRYRKISAYKNIISLFVIFLFLVLFFYLTAFAHWRPPADGSPISSLGKTVYNYEFGLIVVSYFIFVGLGGLVGSFFCVIRNFFK